MARCVRAHPCTGVVPGIDRRQRGWSKAPYEQLTCNIRRRADVLESLETRLAPILKDELTQLGALKKDTALSGLKKGEKLREIGTSFDAKMMPLLNPEQQQKFQTLREEARCKMIEAMGSAAAEGRRKGQGVPRFASRQVAERRGAMAGP